MKAVHKLTTSISISTTAGASSRATPTMKLPQFVHSFADPLRNEDATPLLRLLDCRNRMARGLSQTVGAIDVSCTCARVTTYML